MDTQVEHTFIDALDFIASEEDNDSRHLVCTVDFVTQGAFTERTTTRVSASLFLIFILFVDLKM